MKRTDLPQRLQRLLHEICFATIASVCPDGQPWNTPMVAHFDDDLNLYWLTNKFSEHVRNIEHEPRIFVTVYDSRLPNGSPEIDALYLMMRAEIFSTHEAIAKARQSSGLDFTDNLPSHEDFLGDCPRRFIKAKAVKIWHSIDIQKDGHTIDAREELMQLTN